VTRLGGGDAEPEAEDPLWEEGGAGCCANATAMLMVSMVGRKGVVSPGKMLRSKSNDGGEG